MLKKNQHYLNNVSVTPKSSPSVTMEPKKGDVRGRSESVGGIGLELTNAESSDGCSTNVICGIAGFSGLPLLGGRRASVSQDRWICPNDRQLALRAKLSMGWSTGQTAPPRNQETLSESETKVILDVIRKAEELDVNEQQRVGRLVQKVEKMKQKRMGNGSSTCILCGGNLPMLRTSSLVCADCSKGVCSKCGVEVLGTSKETLWLCKICSETREMWKRSGAWFFRGLPKHILPTSKGSNSAARRGKPVPRRWNTMAPKTGHGLEETDTSSEDDGVKKHRLQKATSEIASSETQDSSIKIEKSSLVSNRPSKPKGIPPVTPDPLPFPIPSRSRSISPSPLRIDLTGVKGSQDSTEDKPIDRSPLSPAAISPRDFNRTPSRESAGGGDAGGLLTPRYCPSPSSLSPRSELKRDHAFDRSPSPLLRVAWRDSGRSSNSSVSESSISCSREDPEGEPSQLHIPPSPSPFSKGTAPSSAAPSVTSSNQSVTSLTPVGGSGGLIGSISPVVNGFRSRRGSEASRSSSEDKKHSKLAKVSINTQDSRESMMTATSYESRDSLLSRESTKDEVNNVGSLDDVFQDSTSENGGGAVNDDKKGNGHLGVLDFSLLYDSHNQALHCTLHSAKELRPLDNGSTLDCYVKLHLLPGPSKSNKLKSQIIQKTVNPEFNETLTYHGISDEDMAKKILRLTVVDEERFKHDALGEIRIPLKTLIPHESRRITKNLDPKVSLLEDESKEVELGKILLSLKYSSQRCALLVGVVRCAHLPSMDTNGFSDPYVKVYLKQGKVTQKKFKTTIKWRNLNPEFNEEFAFEMRRNEVAKKALEIRVYDKDVGRTDDFIGGVVFSQESGGTALRHWYDVINYPDRRHDRWHNLLNMKCSV